VNESAGGLGPDEIEERVIDVHTHVVLDDLPVVDDPFWPVLQVEGGKRWLALSTGRRRAVPDASVDMLARLREMDAIGVGRHVLSPIPAQLADAVVDAEVAVDVARAVNDAVASYVDVAPSRLSGLGTLPVADPADVHKELERCVGDLGLRGIELSSEGFFRLVERGVWVETWTALRDLGAWLLVHPQDDALARRRGVQGRLAIGGVAMTTETALVAVEMMRQGTVATAGKVILAHGGGALPFVLGRLDRLWETTDARKELPAPPSEVFRDSFFVDTCVHDHESLALVAGKTEPNKLLFGSDFPFVIGVSTDVVQGAGLTDPAAVLAGNARAAGICSHRP
jgi:aminocarboxymuconate-semialdehyde decarboxylase